MNKERRIMNNEVKDVMGENYFITSIMFLEKSMITLAGLRKLSPSKPSTQLSGGRYRLQCYLKSSYISFGKFIFGIFHKDRGSSFERVKFLIDFIPVGTVSNEFAGNRGGGGFINFVQGNKKPFAMEPLFDCFDFFSFHIIHHICKYILRAGESQQERFAIQKTEDRGQSKWCEISHPTLFYWGERLSCL